MKHIEPIDDNNVLVRVPFTGTLCVKLPQQWMLDDNREPYTQQGLLDYSVARFHARGCNVINPERTDPGCVSVEYDFSTPKLKPQTKKQTQ